MSDFRVNVEAEADSLGELQTMLDEQAQRFFGDQPHRRDGPIDVSPVERDVTWGSPPVTRWFGRASYVDRP